MNTFDTTTLDDLDRAFARLTDRELTVFVVRMSGLAHSFLDDDERRVADLLACLCVLGAEQQDHRRGLVEHARVQVDGDDIGGLLSDTPPEW